ncbi:19345_t:CDS:2 [Gigaspora margarita]|uniref:19345_t:CDS:1 n=1 Tax=Gigaspora margarita TaxID=4874 RepID=A0ABN7UA98_GIGMA|nr:19345_t:CDS:2 [Gigaspora margarita]
MSIFSISIIFDIINDRPVISYSYIKEDLSIPDIFNLYKYLESQNNSDIFDTSCNKYITDPSEKIGSYYNGYFSIPLKDSYKLVLPNNTKYGKRGEQIIDFQLQFLDVNVDENTSSSFFVQISDSENVDLDMNVSSIFSQSIAQANNYTILIGQNFHLYLRRNIRKFIIPNWKAIMGFQPDYIIKPYITSKMGDDAIQPFGLLHNRGHFYKRTQNKLTEFLSTYPLVHLLDSSNNIDDEDDKSRVDHLEKKINDLELFLRDYVVEVQQLDNAYKNSESAKDK